MALPRKAKQKGIELLNYGKNRNNRVERNSCDKPSNCVICLDTVDKTNTCPLCKQRFRCITKIALGQPNVAPQKIRVKDKNQSNISIADDDYEVAMGIARQQDESSDEETRQELDESFRPSPQLVTSRRRSSLTLRSGHVGSHHQQQQEHTMLTRQVRRGLRLESNRQRELRFQRRNAGVVEIDPVDTTVTTSSIDLSSFTSSAHNNRDSPVDSITSQSLDNNYDEQFGSDSVVNDEDVDDKDDNDDGFSRSGSSNRNPAILTTSIRKRKKRKTIRYQPPKRNSYNNSNSQQQWIDMSAKKIEQQMVMRNAMQRKNRRQPSELTSSRSSSTSLSLPSRSSLSRSAKQNTLNRIKEQNCLLNASLDQLVARCSTNNSSTKEEILSSPSVSEDFGQPDSHTPFMHQRPKKLRRLRLISDSSIDESMTVVATPVRAPSSRHQESSCHGHSCSSGGEKRPRRSGCSAPSSKNATSAKQQLTTDSLSRHPSSRSSRSQRCVSESHAVTGCSWQRENNANPILVNSPSPIHSDDDKVSHKVNSKKNSCDFEIKLVDSSLDSDPTSPQPVVNEGDSRPTDTKQNDDAPKKKFTFRRMQNRLFNACSKVEPSLFSVKKTSEVVRKRPKHGDVLEEIDRTCVLVSNNNVTSEVSVSTIKTPDRCKRTFEVLDDDLDISGVSISWFDDQISPCILSQTSTRSCDSRRAVNNKVIQAKENSNVSHSVRTRRSSNCITVIETTPDAHIKSCTTARDSLLRVETTPVKKDVLQSFRIETSPFTKCPAVYPFKNFKRKFHHYSPAIGK